MIITRTRTITTSIILTSFKRKKKKKLNKQKTRVNKWNHICKTGVEEMVWMHNEHIKFLFALISQK